MKKLSLAFFTLFITTTSNLIICSQNQPPQKKRRIETNSSSSQTNNHLISNTTHSPLLNPLQRFNEYCNSLEQYENLSTTKKKLFWRMFFQSSHNESTERITRNLCALIPRTHNIVIFNEIITHIKQLPSERFLATLYPIRHLINRFPEATSLTNLLTPFTQRDFALRNHQKIRSILDNLIPIIHPAYLAQQRRQAGLLNILASKVLQAQNLNDFKTILTALKRCQINEQAIFLDRNFEYFFINELEQEASSITLLILNHLKDLLNRTNHPATCGYIAKIIAQIGFENHLKEKHQNVALIALHLIEHHSNAELIPNIKSNIINYIDAITKTIKNNLFWFTPFEKEERKEKQKAYSQEFLNHFNTIQDINDQEFIQIFSKPRTARLSIEKGGSFSLKVGIKMDKAQSIFFSQGSKKLQKLTPEAQKAFLKNLKKRSSVTKRAILHKKNLWSNIIDTSVAIKYLKTIKTLEEEEQLSILIQDTGAENLEECMRKYQTSHKLDAPFYESLMQHIETFSQANQIKIFQSKLFKTVIPHIGQIATIIQNFYTILNNLPVKDQYKVLKDHEFLGNYVTDYIAGPWIIKAIANLPENLRTEIFKEIFSCLVETDIPDDIERLSRLLAPNRLCLLLTEVQKLSLKNLIALFYLSPKLLYNLIKDLDIDSWMEETEQPAYDAIENLIENLSKKTQSNLTSPQEKEDIGKIFSTLLCRLMEKPLLIKPEKKYRCFGKIPESLPFNIKCKIAEIIIYTSTNLVSEDNIPDIEDWISQNQILSQTIDLLYKNKKSPEVKNLFWNLQKEQTLEKISQAIENFYGFSFIQMAAKKTVQKKYNANKYTMLKDPRIKYQLSITKQELLLNKTKFLELYNYYVKQPDCQSINSTPSLSAQSKREESLL